MKLNVWRGQAVYSRLTLPFYDFWVHGVSNPMAWGCPTGELLYWCNRHISANHLDVGVGSGFLLDRAHFPHACPRIVLMDLNETSLVYTARRLARYHPDTHRTNILEPIDYDGEPFDSVGLNYLLHCVPGNLTEKAVAFDHLARLLNPGGVLFGSTIIADEPRNLFARGLIEAYNRAGIFHNRNDREEDLRRELQKRFTDVKVERWGQVCLFAARRRGE